MIGGFVASLIVFAVGAILDFAVTISPYQHGFNINTVGVILMIVGGIAALACLIAIAATGGPRRRHTVMEDSAGNVVRRQDTYI